MGPSELLQRVATVLQQLQVAYLVTGSTATIAYGEPRFTNDLDIVVDLPSAKVAAFCQAFPAPEFYCSPDAVRLAVKQHFQFNILLPTSGLKVDFMIPDASAFNRSRLSRAVQLPVSPGFTASFASAEDVIVKKLEFYQLGGSEKYLRDILGVLRIRAERIDRRYISQWATRLGLADQWQRILDLEEQP